MAWLVNSTSEFKGDLKDSICNICQNKSKIDIIIFNAFSFLFVMSFRCHWISLPSLYSDIDSTVYSNFFFLFSYENTDLLINVAGIIGVNMNHVNFAIER